MTTYCSFILLSILPQAVSSVGVAVAGVVAALLVVVEAEPGFYKGRGRCHSKIVLLYHTVTTK